MLLMVYTVYTASIHDNTEPTFSSKRQWVPRRPPKFCILGGWQKKFRRISADPVPPKLAPSLCQWRLGCWVPMRRLTRAGSGGQQLLGGEAAAGGRAAFWITWLNLLPLGNIGRHKIGLLFACGLRLLVKISGNRVAARMTMPPVLPSGRCTPAHHCHPCVNSYYCHRVQGVQKLPVFVTWRLLTWWTLTL